MKQKLLATIAVCLVIFGGVVSPVFSLFGETFQTQHAYAQSSGGTDASTIDNQTTAGLNSLDCGTNFICGAVSLISDYGIFVPKALAAVGGMILDYSIWNTIQSTPYTDQDQTSSFVVQGWKLVRDFSNLIFIFALFAIAFSLILGTNVGGLDPKRTIITVILMALLVNFSFFLCRMTIDVTNIFAGVFYDKITAPSASQDSHVNSSVNNGGDTSDTSLGSTQTFYDDADFSGMKSISLGILDQVNPQALVLGNTGAQGSGGWWTLGWRSYDSNVYILILFVTFISGLFDFFLLYLFATSAIFLIGRTIGLFFFIILSPIAFISVIIPSFKVKAYFGFDDWLTQFTGLALTAPIYLFFVYLAVVFLKAPLLTPTDNPGLLTTSAIILIKLAVIGMILIFGKKVTKDLSGKVGAMTANAVTGVVKVAAAAGGAFATGGLSGVAEFGMSQARQKVRQVGVSTSKKVLGQERTEELQKRWGAVKNFNLRAMAKVATAGPESYFVGDVAKAARYGAFSNRQVDIKKAVAAKEKDVKLKTSEINFQLEKLKKQKVEEPWNGDEIDKEIKEKMDALQNVKDPTYSIRKEVGKAKKKLKDNDKVIKDLKESLWDETNLKAREKLTGQLKSAEAKRDREKPDLEKKVADGEIEQKRTGITAEIESRERTPKIDTLNKAKNNMEIDKLKTTLGGLPPAPPAPPTPPPTP